MLNSKIFVAKNFECQKPERSLKLCEKTLNNFFNVLTAIKSNVRTSKNTREINYVCTRKTISQSRIFMRYNQIKKRIYVREKKSKSKFITRYTRYNH